MSLTEEVKHVLENQFYFKPNSRFYEFLLNNTKIGIGLNDCIILEIDLIGSNGSRFKLRNCKDSLISQIDEYEDYSFDAGIEMNHKCPLLLCIKEDFDRFKKAAPTKTSNYSKPSHEVPPHDAIPSNLTLSTLCCMQRL